ITRALAIQPELVYIEKGISFGNSEAVDMSGNPLGTYETLLVQQNLEIPLLLRWGIPTGGRLHPALEVGPFYSFELSELLKFTGSVTKSTDSHLRKNTGYGLVLGAALGLDVGRAQWVVEGRYEPGLAALGTLAGSEAHSNAFVISTGVRF